jgi:pyruvate/2-oxoglutarate/acetoin dehydrogenase E1 component
MSSPEARSLNYRDAVIEALAEEMRRDADVVLMGEDIGKAGGVFQQTKGLYDEFGPTRVIDTPISESGAFGMAIGAAMTGLRPVFEVMFGDFLTLIMDQLVNQAAKIRYMSGGSVSVPLVVRTTMGTGAHLGPQHSQSLYAWACHVPGLKVVIPSTAADAKGLYKAAIRDPDPVLIFEDRLLYNIRGPMLAEDSIVEFGKASILRGGQDATVIAVGRMCQCALQAADILAAEGVEIEIVDPRTLVPLDVATLTASVQRTSRVLVVDGGARQYGAGAEIAATLAESAFDWLDAPVARLCGADVPISVSRSLEPLLQPDAQRIAAAVRDLIS